MRFANLMAAAACAALVACAQVPKESVQLSSTMGRDLQELQRSHRKAIDLLLDRDIERVDKYVRETVMPLYVKVVLDPSKKVGPRLAADLNKALSADATQEDKDRAFAEMRKVVEGVMDRVERQRKEFTDEIEAARKARLQELDMAYAQLQQANAVLTAHLASIVKVNTAQDEVLAKAGLQNFREKVGEAALDADKQVEEALKTATDVDDALKKVKEIFAKSSSSK